MLKTKGIRSSHHRVRLEIIAKSSVCCACNNSRKCEYLGDYKGKGSKIDYHNCRHYED